MVYAIIGSFHEKVIILLIDSCVHCVTYDCLSVWRAACTISHDRKFNAVSNAYDRYIVSSVADWFVGNI